MRYRRRQTDIRHIVFVTSCQRLDLTVGEKLTYFHCSVHRGAAGRDVTDDVSGERGLDTGRPAATSYLPVHGASPERGSSLPVPSYCRERARSRCPARDAPPRRGQVTILWVCSVDLSYFNVFEHSPRLKQNERACCVFCIAFWSVDSQENRWNCCRQTKIGWIALNLILAAAPPQTQLGSLQGSPDAFSWISRVLLLRGRRKR